MGSKTTSGRPVFAKNSDRPSGECQPVIQVEAADHPAAARCTCQYIEIDQVGHTYGFLGSRPYWLWGVEQGVNDCTVAIGNHTIFTRDDVAETGLLGMDLVRLGLERGGTAREAVDVLIALIEEHGQGGSGYVDMLWPYHNSFLIADPDEAFLLEASARQWALREIDTGASATNQVTIGTDWSRLSNDCLSHAVEQGWWQERRGRFDFAAAYKDARMPPALVCSGRYATTKAALAGSDGLLSAAHLMRVMRDHYEAGEVFLPGREPDDEKYFSVCMHAEPVGTTTASMVVELGRDRRAPCPCWIALCNPCIAPYLPLFLQGSVPAELQTGGAEASLEGAWWRFKGLLSEVEKDYLRYAPLVRHAWRDFETELHAEVADLQTFVSTLDAGARNLRLTTFMADVWRRSSDRLDKLLAALG